MKGKIKNFIAIIVVLTLLFNIILPTINVYANDGDIIFQDSTVEYNVAIYNNLNLSGHAVNIAMWVHKGDSLENIELNADGNGHVDGFEDVKVYADISAVGGGSVDYGEKIGIDLAGGRVTFTKVEVDPGIYNYMLELPENTQQLMVRPQDFFYEENENNPNIPNNQNNENGGNNPGNANVEKVKTNISYKFNGTTGEVVINGVRAGVEGASWSGEVEHNGTTDSSKTNEIIVTTSFGEPKVSKITINEKDYTFTDGSDMHTITVPGATSYTITATADTNIEVDRTIIWANPDATDIDSKDAQISHGNAKIIAVYDKDGNKVNSNNYTQEGSEGGVIDGNGWANIAPGSKVVFEFVPEYGYQLTKVAANEQTLEAQDTTNQYVFTMPNTNVHFAAEFTKTEDIVKASSKKVSSGSIALGSNLDSGSAQLIVNDVELGAEKVKGFQNAAGDYAISNFLDIDLYNVFYKGKSDSDDVWSNKISELDKEATITLKLEDGLTADDIVIVHNIHDGDEYEIIKIESYDPVTNTITFKTKSFSNYAIATKATKTSKTPATGDTILMYVGIMAVAVIAFGGVIIAKKN